MLKSDVDPWIGEFGTVRFRGSDGSYGTIGFTGWIQRLSDDESDDKICVLQVPVINNIPIGDGTLSQPINIDKIQTIEAAIRPANIIPPRSPFEGK
jgi:hypothetical protein